ncbi:MAG TPA: phosphoribosylformylglycinamidine synthase, partial [Euryarchaeota archaeon]|nr:phosphoribosylformylglycinamidine synthase [Euryarchaeota archaeon]
MREYIVRNLTDDEKSKIIKKLGRNPNDVEWAMIDVMWSEHVSYKSSRSFIRRFLRSSGRHVVVGPGQDAGIIRIADDIYIAFKIESHNHPSAVDPYGGSSTGIGGIVRDILSMGAQPIALLDSLHFGDLDKRRTWFHILGVVKGISDYGNRIGVPTVGGETKFSSCYNENPLVNVACIGIVNRIVPSVLNKPDSALVLYGNRTGRDGIHGVSFASETLDEESIEEDRSAVQIGDPLTEKLLIDASLEIFSRGLAYALKDLGGGGLTCAVSEMVGKGGVGAVIELDRVPLREENMRPYEILISESQERMLLATSYD